MKTTEIYKDEKRHVIAFEYRGKFMYTRTYIYGEDGYVEKDIKVFADGTVEIN